MRYSNTLGDKISSNAISGTPQSDHIVGSDGDDAISGFRGDDFIEGNAGNDWLDGDSGADVLDGGEGIDWVNYGRDINDPNAANTHGVSIDLINGKAIDNWGSVDTLISVEGAIGSNYNDRIAGNSNDNNLIGNGGDDHIDGADGNDWLIGWTGNDTIYGGAGVEWIEGGAGNDFIDGGAGSDWVNYRNEDSDNAHVTGHGISVDLEQNSAIDNWGDKDNLVDIENVNGSRFNDEIKGDDKNNSLSGFEGNDLVYGRGGDDFLFGFSGNDQLIGGLGDDFLQGDEGEDVIDGGAGTDWVSYNEKSDTDDALNSGAKVYLSLGEAVDVQGYKDKLIGVEHVIGSNQGDEIFGDYENNCLMGLKGNDILSGSLGDDWLIGGEGNDILKGEEGNDWIDGGAGADHLEGGQGRDFFVFSSVNDFGDVNNRDSISDFRSGTDVISLLNIDANAFLEGDQSFTYAANDAGAGSIWFVNGILYGDIDGNGADFSLEIGGMNTPPLANDFLL